MAFLGVVRVFLCHAAWSVCENKSVAKANSITKTWLHVVIAVRLVHLGLDFSQDAVMEYFRLCLDLELEGVSVNWVCLSLLPGIFKTVFSASEFNGNSSMSFVARFLICVGVSSAVLSGT